MKSNAIVVTYENLKSELNESEKANGKSNLTSVSFAKSQTPTFLMKAKLND